MANRRNYDGAGKVRALRRLARADGRWVALARLWKPGAALWGHGADVGPWRALRGSPTAVGEPDGDWAGEAWTAVPRRTAMSPTGKRRALARRLGHGRRDQGELL